MKYKLDNILPDEVDDRDYVYTASTVELPTNVDLRDYTGSIENQGHTGSCVANATVSALEVILAKGNKFRDLSRLFLYYNLREPYASLKEKDTGSYLRDGFKSISKLGICDESTWTFDVRKVNVKPDEVAYKEAKNHLVSTYKRIIGFSNYGGSDRAILLMKAALAEGLPVAFAMKVGKSIFSIKGPLEDQKYVGVNDDSAGGHALNCVGYSDELNGFIGENSWGTAWGDKGYFLVPYTVMLKDCHDAWVCSSFDGVTPEHVWEDTSPEIVAKDKSETITHYQEDGRVFNFNVELLTGTEVQYKWYEFNMFKGMGTFKANNSSCTYTMNIGKTRGVIFCKLQGNGPLKKEITTYHTAIYKDEPRPKKKVIPTPVKPKKKVVPVPESKKKDSDKAKCNLWCKIKKWFKKVF